MIRTIVYIAVIGFAITSCNTLKPISSQPPAIKSETAEPRFIKNINITPSERKTIPATSTGSKQAATSFIAPSYSASLYSGSVATESLTSLQFKYGILLNIAVEQLTNIKLLETIEDWYGTRYSYGGTTKMGIDCSAFASTLLMTVFGISLPRTARDQYAASKHIGKDELQEGDLVFFNTRGGISHVGVYLNNNKFVHASTSSGVIISDLDEDYYTRSYVGAGRVVM